MSKKSAKCGRCIHWDNPGRHPHGLCKAITPTTWIAFVSKDVSGDYGFFTSDKFSCPLFSSLERVNA